MTELTHTATTERLTKANHDDVVRLMLEGRRISEVIAHGLTRQPGWRRKHVVDIVAAYGWTLDSDGRVPKEHRTRTQPATEPIVPGGPAPEPPREPAAQWDGHSTRSQIQAVPVVQLRGGEIQRRNADHLFTPPAARPPGAPTAEAAIAAGKAHPDAKVRHRAQRAEDAIAALLELLREDAKTARIRARLAELDAERARLVQQLGGKPRKTRKTPDATVPAAPTTTGGLLPAGTSEANGGKPINHGGWGGFQTHRKRGEEACADCQAGMETHMDAMRARSPRGGKAPAGV